MADDEGGEKTEEPTAKKLADAEKKGDMAQSMEFKTWFLFLVATGALAAAGGMFANSIFIHLRRHMTQLHLVHSDGSSMLDYMRGFVADVGLIMIFPFMMFMIAGVLSNVLQHKTVLTFEKIKPDLKKISPLSGLKKKFSMTTLVEALKTLGKLGTVAAVVVFIVYPERENVESLLYMDVLDVLSFVYILVVRLFIGVLIILTFIAALDYSYQRYSFMEKMKMTKQEVKDEHKQAEGDPLIKGKIRALRQERSRQRMMAAVPEADVVITNPTHYAVALEYKHDTMDVPRVVAKGVDSLAFKIREIAEENQIPIVENPPLARALHATVDVDEDVSPDHYKAVAEVIGYIMKLRRAGLGATKNTRH